MCWGSGGRKAFGLYHGFVYSDIIGVDLAKAQIHSLSNLLASEPLPPLFISINVWWATKQEKRAETRQGHHQPLIIESRFWEAGISQGVRMVTESQQTPSLPSLLQWGLLLPSALHSASRGRWRSGAWWDVLLLGVCLASSLQLLASWITKNPAWPLQARHILQLPQWIFPRLESIFSSFTSLINGFLSMMILTYETSSECQIQFIQNCSPGPRDNPELSTAQSTTSSKQGSA